MESGGIRPPSAAPAAAAPQQLTPEEAALKRNTDCVYFLASPLTCKKGSECEYRHSEGARVNPRDCHYWMYGNCTNRKCAYRHPPLDGLFGGPPTPAAPVGPQAIGPQATAYNPTKLSVPCHYFRKGNCIKGDRCPFMHGPPLSATNAIPQQPAKVSASPVTLFGTQRKEPSNPSTIAKPAQNNPSFGANNTKNTQEKQVFNPSKPVLNSSGPNGAAPAIPKPRADFTVNNKTNQLDNLPVEDHPKFAQNQYPSGRGTPVQNHDRSDERPQDSREGDEFLGESSPGFDVIVDHDEEGSGYLPQNEEDFRRAFADPYDPAEMYPLDDYEPMSRYERDRHGVMPDQHEYEPEFNHEADCFGYNGGNDQFDRKRPRRDSSSERALDRPSRRPSHREEVGVVVAESRIEGSDLRHRLMNKHKMPNGSRSSRSDVSSDKRDDRRHRHSNRRDEKYPEERDRHRSRGTEHRSNRLQGRIKMPLRPAERSDLMHEDIIEMERRRHMRGGARVSPVPPVDFPLRHHRERIGRLSSDREFVGRPPPASRRDDVGFAGPKSLSELKKSVKGTDKVSEGGGRVVKEKSAINFEGPKPLSVILKRKREAAGVPSGNGSSSENKEAPVNNAVIVEHEEVEEGMIPDGNGTDYEVQEDASKLVGADEGEFQEDGEMEEPYDETAQGEDLNYYEGEEGEEYKMDDDSAYQKEGEEANEYPEGEEVFEEEEDDDDDDEQAFARKVGVLYS